MQKEQQKEQQENISKAERIVNSGKQRRRHVYATDTKRSDSLERHWSNFVTQPLIVLLFLLYGLRMRVSDRENGRNYVSPNTVSVIVREM